MKIVTSKDGQWIVLDNEPWGNEWVVFGPASVYECANWVEAQTAPKVDAGSAEGDMLRMDAVIAAEEAKTAADSFADYLKSLPIGTIIGGKP